MILGLLSLFKLPLQQFPDIAPPAVLVTAVYPGANAETVLRSVAPSLEESINGVENMSYMSSTASNDGTLAITVYFKQGTNPDQAAVNVQNRVAHRPDQLPAEVVQQGITTTKQQNSLIGAVGMCLRDRKNRRKLLPANYAMVNIIPELKKRIPVSSAVMLAVLRITPCVFSSIRARWQHKITPAEVIAIQDKTWKQRRVNWAENRDI